MFSLCESFWVDMGQAGVVGCGEELKYCMCECMCSVLLLYFWDPLENKGVILQQKIWIWSLVFTLSTGTVRIMVINQYSDQSEWVRSRTSCVWHMSWRVASPAPLTNGMCEMTEEFHPDPLSVPVAICREEQCGCTGHSYSETLSAMRHF